MTIKQETGKGGRRKAKKTENESRLYESQSRRTGSAALVSSSMIFRSSSRPYLRDAQTTSREKDRHPSSFAILHPLPSFVSLRRKGDATLFQGSSHTHPHPHTSAVPARLAAPACSGLACTVRLSVLDCILRRRASKRKEATQSIRKDAQANFLRSSFSSRPLRGNLHHSFYSLHSLHSPLFIFFSRSHPIDCEF